MISNPQTSPTATGTDSRKAILVGTTRPGSPGGEASLDELEGLATTAGYRPVARYLQPLHTVNPKTFIGSGKVRELAEAAAWHHPEVVIFDEALSPAQNKHLENALGCRVMDRQGLILEIFSDHARTREARTQVELARLKYALPRLTRMWGHLSRQRGGIGLREVGEKQLQLDKRMIRDQIHKLEKQLERIDRERQVQRRSRRRAFQVALVGYTNVGKSTLMNLLTEAETRVENKLFATLDATVRKVKKNFPYPILLADTVGLIDKLPHDLVASFKSTLDEVRDAKLLLHVVDLSHPDYQKQMETAERLIAELGADRTERILVFNKIDRVKDPAVLDQACRRWPEAVFISCREKTGLDRLRQAIVSAYEKHLPRLRTRLPYERAQVLPEIRKNALVVAEDYRPEGIDLDLRIFPERRSRLEHLLNGHAGK